MVRVQSLRTLADGLAARGLPGRAQLIWLLDCASSVGDAELDAFARYGAGIGPEKVPPCSPVPEPRLSRE